MSNEQAIRARLARQISSLITESGLYDQLTVVVSERREGNVYAVGIGGAGIQWKLSHSEPGLLLPKGEVEAMEQERRFLGYRVVIDESLPSNGIQWYLRADNKPPIIAGDFQQDEPGGS